MWHLGYLSAIVSESNTSKHFILYLSYHDKGIIYYALFFSPSTSGGIVSHVFYHCATGHNICDLHLTNWMLKN